MDKGIKIAFYFLLSILILASLAAIVQVYLPEWHFSQIDFGNKFDSIDRTYLGLGIVFFVLIALRIPNVRIFLSRPGQLFSKFILLFYGKENKKFMIPLFAAYGLWEGYEGKYFIIADKPELSLALSMLVCSLGQIFLWYLIHLAAMKVIPQK